MVTQKPKPVVLVFAGLDPSGGAGLTADAVTLQALGCHAACVATAITVQNTEKVYGYETLDPRLIEAQADAVIEDMPVVAVKTGMLGSAAVAAGVARVMERLPGVPLIVDPVIASDAGDALANADFARTLMSRLAPRAILLTPNLPEARLLSGIEGSPDECAAELMRYLRGYLLIKGTHDDTPDVVHRLYFGGRAPVSWKFPRRPGTYHGSGCTLASAATAYLAHGQQMSDAVTAALAYTFRSVFKAYKPGQGQFVPDRLGACRA